MKRALWLVLAAWPAALLAQGAATLPAVTVYSQRIANQTPAATFAMPVSLLRFEPAVDIQGRNFAEGQADVTIRGGIFENTAFQIGAATVWDPQTGHYFAELPVAPAFLQAPELRTGAELAARATNATSGSVAYDWRKVTTAGAASIGIGEHGLKRGELYQGCAGIATVAGRSVGADLAFARSKSDGAVPFGDHDFSRINARLQLAGHSSQTDLFAGYQEKFFGWPNLYTPFDSHESDNLQTVLLALNHQQSVGTDGTLEAAAFHRRNKDDYAFNRFAPLGAVHPFQHTTWTTGAALGGRQVAGNFALSYRGEVLADEIESTSLTFGRFQTRSLTKLSLVPEWTARMAQGARLALKAGGAWDDGNRDRSAVSPILEITREDVSSPIRRMHLSYSEATQVPTYTALNSSSTAGLFRGNAFLGRQRSRNLEVGMAAAYGDWSGTAALFWRRDESLVDWTFRRGVTARTASAVDIDVAGFEMYARRSSGWADCVVGYTLLEKEPDYRQATVDASFYALNYARHRLTLAFTLRLGAGLELRIDNVARLQADNLLRTTGGDEALISAVSLAFRPPAWKRFEISVHVDNLWNSRFQEIPSVPATPRQVALGFAATW